VEEGPDGSHHYHKLQPTVISYIRSILEVIFQQTILSIFPVFSPIPLIPTTSNALWAAIPKSGLVK
jgi:hypothetical protein